MLKILYKEVGNCFKNDIKTYPTKMIHLFKAFGLESFF